MHRQNRTSLSLKETENIYYQIAIILSTMNG